MSFQVKCEMKLHAITHIIGQASTLDPLVDITVFDSQDDWIGGIYIPAPALIVHLGTAEFTQMEFDIKAVESGLFNNYGSRMEI